MHRPTRNAAGRAADTTPGAAHGPTSGSPLARCPACGDEHLVGIVDADGATVLCPACDRCWRVELGRVSSVDAPTCAACPHGEACGGAPRRAGDLAAGLRSIGVLPKSALTILVCDEHDEDRTVAALAARILGASVTVCAVDQPTDTLSECLRTRRHAVLLACGEGADAWRRTRVPLRVVGDGPGVVWWRALELQQSARRTQPAVPS